MFVKVTIACFSFIMQWNFLRKYLILAIFFVFIGFVSGCGIVSDRDVFLKDVQESNDLATGWLVANVRDKGLFYYIFEPKQGNYPDKNNAIRQLMASRLLAELSHEDRSLMELHTKNVDFVMTNWYKEDGDVAYMLYNNKSKLGANAMALRLLLESPLYDEYRDQADKLAKGILSLVQEDGSFVPWYVEPSYDYDADYLLTFYSGEALVALVEYYEKTEGPEYLAAAMYSQDFYVDRYVDNIEQYYYPAYVPWHTISLNKLYKITGEARYAEAIFVLNDKLLELLDRTDFVGRFYKPETSYYGTPHVASDGVYTEGLAYAYEIAKRVGDSERMKQYEEALYLALQNLRSLQYTDERLARFSHEEPWRLLGAFMYRVGDSRIRTDNTQHTIDAYRKILEVFE